MRVSSGENVAWSTADLLNTTATRSSHGPPTPVDKYVEKLVGGTLCIGWIDSMFAGTAITGVAALRYGRQFVLIGLERDYIRLAKSGWPKRN